jgi:hypothetical protein
MTITEALQRLPATVPPGLGDPALATAVAPFIHYEARLLDERSFASWLDLYTDDAVLVIAMRRGGDPARELTVTVDDRRRLTDRVTWLQGDATWCQRPPPETLRVVGSVEAWPWDDAVLVRSTTTLWVSRPAGVRPVPAEQLHLLVGGNPYAIRMKRLTPLGVERGLWDPSAVL